MGNWKKRETYGGSVEIVEWVDGWGTRLVAANVNPAYADVIARALDAYEVCRLAVASTDTLIAEKAARVLGREGAGDVGVGDG